MKIFYVALLLLSSPICFSQTPCPGLDSINYSGQWYHTVQIDSQCWFKENLNVGRMILGTQDQTDNGILEKYC